MGINKDEILAQAEREIQEEAFRKAVEETKNAIRSKTDRKLLDKLFPTRFIKVEKGDFVSIVSGKNTRSFKV